MQQAKTFIIQASDTTRIYELETSRFIELAYKFNCFCTSSMNYLSKALIRFCFIIGRF